MHSTEIIVDEIDENLIDCLLNESVITIERVDDKYRIVVEFNKS